MGVRVFACVRWSTGGDSSGGSKELETGVGGAGEDESAAAEREGPVLAASLSNFRRLLGRMTSPSSSVGMTASLFSFFRRCPFFCG